MSELQTNQATEPSDLKRMKLNPCTSLAPTDISPTPTQLSSAFPQQEKTPDLDFHDADAGEVTEGNSPQFITERLKQGESSRAEESPAVDSDEEEGKSNKSGHGGNDKSFNPTHLPEKERK